MPAMGLALVLWNGAERPDVLVSHSGGLVGVMTGEGRALSKARGEGFAAESWLENDGDGVSQGEAFDRAGFEGVGRQRRLRLGAAVIMHATGKVASKQAVEACNDVAVLIANVELDAPEGCRVYDAKRLRETGALAIRDGGEGPVVTTARERAGERIWSGSRD